MRAIPAPFRYRALSEHRRDILMESALVLANIAFLVWLVDRNIPPYWHLDRALSLTISFVMVQLGLMGLLAGAMFGLKLREGLRERADRKDTPVVVEKVTAISSGELPPERLTPLYKHSPDTVSRILTSSLAIQRGAGYQRLAAAAEVSGAVRSWKADIYDPSPARRCEAVLRLAALPAGTASEEMSAALDDVEELVAVEAGRAILARGGATEAELVFASLPAQSVLVRALSVASLRRHAADLVTRAIPAALASGDEIRITVALNAIATWKRLLPLEAIRPVLSHASSDVRAAAFRALPFTLAADSFEPELARGLADPVEKVRSAAAAAAGRRVAASLVPSLNALMLSGGDAGREAALVLTSFGDNGVAALEAAVVNGGPVGATATEALERHRLGRGWI